MSGPIDRFSHVAANYARYRPRYPAQLFAYIYSFVNGRDVAWDAGTGSGQVAHVLAEDFTRVYATDISAAQLGQAPSLANITYLQAPSEQTPLPENTVNLITVAQAAHWFDLDAFAAEVRRVSGTDGILAIWGYGLFRCSAKIDALIDAFYNELVGPYWDPQRRHIDTMYAEFEFPFTSLPAPSFAIEDVRTLDQISGYLGTWSAVSKFRDAKGSDPVPDLIASLRKAVGDDMLLRCSTPVFLRLWRV